MPDGSPLSWRQRLHALAGRARWHLVEPLRRRVLRTVEELARRRRMRRSAAQLLPRLVRAEAVDDAWCLLVCCMRNELTRMPAFLAHYRRLGVKHFLVVDNQSTDGLQDYL